MPNPTLGSVHTNAALTNVAIGYRNTNFIADQVFPVVKVAKESDYYYTWTQADIFRNEANIIAPGGQAPRGGFALTSATYTTNQYGFAWPIPDRVRNNMDPAVASEINSTNRVMDKIMLAREIIVCGLLALPASYGGATWTGQTAKDVGSGEYYDSKLGTPLIDIDGASKGIQAKIGKPANTIVMNWAVYRALIRHPEVLDYIGISTAGSGSMYPAGMGPRIVTPEVLSAIIDIPKVLVVTALYNSAAEGQAAVYTSVMTDTIWVGYVAPSPAIDEPSAGYTFRCGDARVRSYREEAAEQDVVEARELYVPKQTLVTAGAIITDCLV